MMSFAGIDLPIVSTPLAEWVRKRIPPSEALLFDPSYASDGLACIPIPSPYEIPPVRPGVLFWPNGASRWAIFHTVLTGDQLAELRTTLLELTPSSMAGYPKGVLRIEDDTNTDLNPIETEMFMLPPKPLSGWIKEGGLPFPSAGADACSEVYPLPNPPPPPPPPDPPYPPPPPPAAGASWDPASECYRETNSLYLVTLVDVRFFWWFRQVTISTQSLGSGYDDPDWEDLIVGVLDGLGETATVPSGIGGEYPPPGTRWNLRSYPAPPILDALLTAIGRRVVRSLDGTITFPTWEEALENSRDQFDDGYKYNENSRPDLSKENGYGRVAGGMIDAEDLRRHVPASVRVLAGSDETDVSLAELFMTHYLAFTGREDELGSVRIDPIPSGEDPTAYLRAAAEDWYGWRLANLDIVFGGLLQWEPTGWEDYIRWAHGSDGTTRVARPPWNLGSAKDRCETGAFGDWILVRITDNDGGMPPSPRLYSWEEINVIEDDGSGNFDWVHPEGGQSGEFNGIRAPSKDYDYPVLPDIPNGQACLARPAVLWPDKWELTPWGGQLRYVERKLIDVCAACEEEETDEWVVAVYTVFRKFRWYARDLRITKAPLTDTEGPILDPFDDG